MQIYEGDKLVFKRDIRLRDSNYGHYGQLQLSWMLTALRTKQYVSYYSEIFSLGIL